MFKERFEQLCTSINSRPNTVVKNITGKDKSGMVNAWLTKGTIPDSSMLISLAEFFGCSVDYLLGRTDTDLKLGVGGVDQLTPDEEELLSYYRELDRAGRRIMLGMVEDYYNSKKGTAKTDAV